MFVHKSERAKVLCLRMKSSMIRTIWDGGQFMGSRCLYSSVK